MLKECTEISSGMSWRQAVPYFEGDLRCSSVPEKEREGLFEEYLSQLIQQQRETAREERREKFRAFRAKLENDVRIHTMTHWREVKEWYAEDAIFLALDKVDRLNVFEEYMKTLERIQEDQNRVAHFQKKTSSRHNREKFREFLRKKFEENSLNVKTKWKDFVKSIKDEEIYQNMISPDQLGSLPSQIFGDFIEELEEKYYKDKKKLKEIIKEQNISVGNCKTIQEFSMKISVSTKISLVDAKNIPSLYQDFMEKAEREEKKKEKDSERKKKKYSNRFWDLLESYYKKKLMPETLWEDAKEFLKEHSTFHKLSSEEEKKKIFLEFLEKKKEEKSEDDEKKSKKEDRDSEDDERRKREKKV
jgi:pre-mRNA-processing factor 40